MDSFKCLLNAYKIMCHGCVFSPAIFNYTGAEMEEVENRIQSGLGVLYGKEES